MNLEINGVISNSKLQDEQNGVQNASESTTYHKLSIRLSKPKKWITYYLLALSGKISKISWKILGMELKIQSTLRSTRSSTNNGIDHIMLATAFKFTRN